MCWYFHTNENEHETKISLAIGILYKLNENTKLMIYQSLIRLSGKQLFMHIIKPASSQLKSLQCMENYGVYGLHFKSLRNIGNCAISISPNQFYLKTRNRTNLSFLTCRLEKTKQPIVFTRVNKYNVLTNELKSMERISSFKFSLEEHLNCF